MHLVRNERLKLAATYLNGLAVAASAIGGIGQIVGAGSTWTIVAWIAISLALHGLGQLFITRLRE